MLKRGLRINRKELKTFFSRKSMATRGDLIYMRALANNKDVTRWAFVVSSGFKRGAVSRNTARRRISEIANGLQQNVKGGWDIVLFFKLNSRKVPLFNLFKNDIIKLLKRLSLHV